MPAQIDSDEPQEFTVQLEGDLTGKTYFGKFAAKRLLSHKDRMARDRVRREHLGIRPQDATAEAIAEAEVFSQLSVRLVKMPEWWIASDFGGDLKDTNVVGEVYKKALAVEDEYLAALAKRAEERKGTMTEKLPAIEDAPPPPAQPRQE